MPILSIVIANFNYGRYLDAAIRSVIGQRGFADCELIVVDGGSTDESVSVIERYKDKIAWWCSESDKGQSDAFNKGFSRASGKYLTWLNADDLMPDYCLSRIVDELRRHPDCDWFTGNMLRFTEDGLVTEIGWGPRIFPRCLQRKDSPASIAVFGPSAFFSKRIYEQVGRIDEKLVNTMDYDLWIKFVMAGIPQRRISCFCWAFRMHEASKSAEYGDHTVTRQVREMISQEGIVIRNRSGYHPKAIWHRVMLMWRILDGSLLKAFWLRRTVKNVDQVVADWRAG